MSERRPHWDDDLIEAVGTAIDDYITVGVLNPQFVYAVIAAVEDWQDANGFGRMGTLMRRLINAEAAIARVRDHCAHILKDYDADEITLTAGDVLSLLDGGAE